MTYGMDGFASLFLEVGAIVIVLWGALWFLMRRGRSIGGGGSTRDCQVVRQLAIGPRERIVVVRIGTRELVVGVGTGSVSLLCELNEPLVQTDPNGMVFGDAVRKALGRWRGG